MNRLTPIPAHFAVVPTATQAKRLLLPLTREGDEARRIKRSMRTFRIVYKMALTLCLSLFLFNIEAQNIQDQSNFVLEEISTMSNDGLTAIAFSQSGILFVAEKKGKIQVLKPDPANSAGYLPAKIFSDLTSQVSSENESGLLGLAVHPNFATNHWLYALYSYNGGQRLVRLTGNVTNDAMTGVAETILEGFPNTQPAHKAGDINFHSDGKLYISLGDDYVPYPDYLDFSKDVNKYHGKILRVDDNGLGVLDNPYYDGNPSSIRSRVWGKGCRNPFRFVLHPVTGKIYVSENGKSGDVVRLWKNKGLCGGIWCSDYKTPLDFDCWP